MATKIKSASSGMVAVGSIKPISSPVASNAGTTRTTSNVGGVVLSNNAGTLKSPSGTQPTPSQIESANVGNASKIDISTGAPMKAYTFTEGDARDFLDVLNNTRSQYEDALLKPAQPTSNNNDTTGWWNFFTGYPPQTPPNNDPTWYDKLDALLRGYLPGAKTPKEDAAKRAEDDARAQAALNAAIAQGNALRNAQPAVVEPNNSGGFFESLGKYGTAALIGAGLLLAVIIYKKK